MNCETIQRELSAYQDGELKAIQMKSVEDHLAGCSSCRQELQRLTQVWNLLDALPTVQPSSDFRARFWEKVRQDEIRKENLWGWLQWPRLAPVAGALAVWLLGITSGLFVFGNRTHQSPTPTERSVSIFTAPYPQNSIEQVFLKGSPTEGKNL